MDRPEVFSGVLRNARDVISRLLTDYILGLPQYVKVGCFRDKKGPLNQRALPELLVNYRGGLDWYNLQQVVKDCASEAKKKNYMYFG